MKKKLALVSIIFIAFITASFTILSDDGRAGVTGSPNENTCNQSGCHNSFTVNTGGGSVTIAAPALTNWEYVPGQTYTINVTVAKSGASLFGLGFEALNSSGANAGTLTAGSDTKILSAPIAGNNRTNIVHTGSGNATSNSHTFSFTWRAPASNIGNVTFYCAGNAANRNGMTSGDYIYTISQIVKPAALTGIEEGAFAKQVTVYPNPAVDYLQIENKSNLLPVMTVSILDLHGRLIEKRPNVGENEKIKVGNLQNGLYLLKIETEEETTIKQFIKQ